MAAVSDTYLIRSLKPRKDKMWSSGSEGSWSIRNSVEAAIVIATSSSSSSFFLMAVVSRRYGWLPPPTVLVSQEVALVMSSNSNNQAHNNNNNKQTLLKRQLSFVWMLVKTEHLWRRPVALKVHSKNWHTLSSCRTIWPDLNLRERREFFFHSSRQWPHSGERLSPMWVNICS